MSTPRVAPSRAASRASGSRLTLLVMGLGNVVDMNVNGPITDRALGPLSGCMSGLCWVTQTLS